MDHLRHLTDEELRQLYNDHEKPNAYGDELLRRIYTRQLADWAPEDRTT